MITAAGADVSAAECMPQAEPERRTTRVSRVSTEAELEWLLPEMIKFECQLV